MTQDIREKTNQFILDRKSKLITYSLVILLINSVSLNLANDIALLEYLVNSGFFVLQGALLLTILDTYQTDTLINSDNYFDNLKNYGFNLFILGLLVEFLKLLFSQIVSYVLAPLSLALPSDAIVLTISLISLISGAVSYLITYMFAFSIYYIKEQALSPFNAFLLSYKETKGKKMTMFKIEFTYQIKIIISVIFAFLIGLASYSPGFAVIVIIIASGISIYYTAYILTARTIYYKEQQEGILD